MPTFNDATNKLMHQPEGDYIFTVIGHEKKISQGVKTSGAEVDNLKLEIRNAKGNTSTMFDMLIDHPNSDWKYDVFLKSTGIQIAKGQRFAFNSGATLNQGDINPLGLRGWCRVILDAYNGKKNNKIELYYTDLPKFPRVQVSNSLADNDADNSAFGQASPPVQDDRPPISDEEIPF